MKKYIVALLMLVSAHALLADATAVPGSIQLSPPAGELAPSMRVITQDEFDGKVPIVIHVNETLVIPCVYQLLFVSSTPQLLFGPCDLTAVNMIVSGVTFADEGEVIYFNLVCTGVQAGQDTVQFGEGSQIVKGFPIQVVE